MRASVEARARFCKLRFLLFSMLQAVPESAYRVVASVWVAWNKMRSGAWGEGKITDKSGMRAGFQTGMPAGRR